MPISMKGWQNKWFYLRKDACTSLAMFTDSHPIPLPSWGDGAARSDLGKLQPMRESLQKLQHEGLIGVCLLQTFFSHRIQLLQQQKTKMWLYLGPSFLDRPSSKELSAVEVNTQIHKVLNLGANSNP
jgi:hypothetical protein